MAPDLTPLASRPRRISLSNQDPFSPSPRSPHSPMMSSLQAAATMNAGLQRSPSTASPAPSSIERRRSSLANNLSINDPGIPAPGEMQSSNNSNSGSPRMSRRSIAMGGIPAPSSNHGRHPSAGSSLGELHQELENEQEAQVNRLLHMIRIQQEQLAAYQQPTEVSPSTEHSSFPTSSLGATPASTAPTEHSSFSQTAMLNNSQLQQLQSTHAHSNRPHSLSRQSSRLSTTSSRGGSPSPRPVSGSLGPLTEDFLLGGTRDESAFYQAETQSLTRENQMLKSRIRELERQVAEITTSSSSQPTGVPPHVPAHNSPLSHAPATFTSESAPSVSAGTKVD